jgi:hypothetical protein
VVGAVGDKILLAHLVVQVVVAVVMQVVVQVQQVKVMQAVMACHLEYMGLVVVVAQDKQALMELQITAAKVGMA